jgi:predicted nucleic acid-binding Zn ribbon protein
VSRSPSSRADGPQPVGELLSRFLNRKGLAAKVEAASVVPGWAELVGPQIAAVTEPLRVSDGTLFVAVETSAWIMELNLMKAEVLRRLNAGKRAGRITGVVFVMGEGSDRKEETGKRKE